MDIFAVVCPNGLGHFKRVLGVFYALRQMKPGLEMGLIASAFAEKRLKNWYKNKNLSLRRFYFAEEEKGVRWALKPEAYRDGSLLSWERQLAGLSELAKARLVLSDNLTAVLKFRPDAVLSGNFLWSDVLEHAYPEEEAVRQFVEQERRLLHKHRPIMLGVEQLVMPSVKAQTRWKGFGFFAQEPRRLPGEGNVRLAGQNRPRIAILGGGTDAAQPFLLQAVWDLAKAGKYDLFLSEKLLCETRAKQLKNVYSFGFSSKDFESCQLVVCRPGVGTITDCVQAGTPLLAVYEPGNVEMRHLAGQVERLGLGYDVGRQGVNVFAERLLQRGHYSACRAKLLAQPTDGIQQMAKALLALLDGYTQTRVV